MSERYETITLDRPADNVLLVTLNRPAAANALNTRMGLDLLDLFTEMAASPEFCRAVVLTGADRKPSARAATSRNGTASPMRPGRRST